MRLLIPKAPEAKPDSAHTLRAIIGWGLGLLLVALLYYLPGFLSQEDNPQSKNLLYGFNETNSGSGLNGPNPLETQFYQDWQIGREQLRSFKLPLWSADEKGGRTLLAESSAPLLYPPSLIYYAAPVKGLTLFALAHFWLFGMGLVMLARKFRRLRYIWLGSLVLLVPLGLMPLDILAALTWLPVGMWLLASPRWTGRFLFAFIVGLIFVAVEWSVALLLVGLLVGWALGCEIALRRASAGQLLRVAGLFSVMLLLGMGIAGPQLFPRLVHSYGPDRTATFTPPPPGQLVQLRPSQNIQPDKLERPGPTEVVISLNVPPGSTPFDLVLAERYVSGWSATVFGNQEIAKSSQEERETEITKGRTNPTKITPEGWRSAQIVPASEGGEFRVRFRYNPLAFTLGLYAAVLALAGVFMCFVAVGWGRFYREDADSHPIRRVAKNSMTPLFAQLFGKGLDFGFALFSLRLLGPEGNGRYTIAVTTWLILATLTDFGLETIVTREVARDRSVENANRLFHTMLFTRFGLALLSFPIAFAWIGGFSLTGNMSGETAWAIIVLLVGFFPGSVSATMTALFRGYEKYEYLAAIQILTAIIRVPIGLGALLIGWGAVGLAGSSVVVGTVTMLALAALFRREIFRPRSKGAFDPKLARSLLVLSFPLVLNGLLNNILFKSDALLLGAIRSEAEVGLYNSAYKFVDAVLIIPSAFVLALFPVLASYGASSKDALKRAYIEGLRLLLIIGLPLSAGTTFVAYDLIGALGGAPFLPGGAICLQILIWFLPFSYVNGLTQYVLIALDKQRLITMALIVTAVANIGLNLLLMPSLGYIAASAITIVSELFMLVPFCWIAWRELGYVPFWGVSWRPLLAVGLMVAVLLGLTVGLNLNHFFIIVPVGATAYVIGLVLTRAITNQDLQMLKKIVRR